MSPFKPYPSYAESEIDWVDRLPDHWRTRKPKHLARIDNSGCYGDEPGRAPIQLPVATTAQIDADGNFHVQKMPVRGFVEAEVERYGCRDGDVLVVKSSGSAANIISGKAGIVRDDTPGFIFSNFLLRLRPHKNLIAPKFLYAMLRSHLTRQRIEVMCSATTYPNLQVGEYVSSLIPYPPLNEQVVIAQRLDRETARIDALIEKKARFIELLKVKRQALITQAVTKGLDPNVKMKDSGVEWIGRVPAHWAVLSFKRFLLRSDGGAWGSDASDESIAVPVLRSTDQTVNGHWRISAPALRKLSRKELEATLLVQGDILITKSSGSADHIGKATLVDAEVADLKAGFSNFMQRLRLNASLLPRFSWYLLNSAVFREHYSLAATTTTGLANLSGGIIGEAVVALPPLPEQKQILADLDRETTCIDSLIQKTTQSIDLLKERRSSLITAAVTGQIDLREAA